MLTFFKYSKPLMSVDLLPLKIFLDSSTQFNCLFPVLIIMARSSLSDKYSPPYFINYSIGLSIIGISLIVEDNFNLSSFIFFLYFITHLTITRDIKKQIMLAMFILNKMLNEKLINPKSTAKGLVKPSSLPKDKKPNPLTELSNSPRYAPNTILIKITINFIKFFILFPLFVLPCHYTMKR